MKVLVVFTTLLFTFSAFAGGSTATYDEISGAFFELANDPYFVSAASCSAIPVSSGHDGNDHAHLSNAVARGKTLGIPARLSIVVSQQISLRQVAYQDGFSTGELAGITKTTQVFSQYYESMAVEVNNQVSSAFSDLLAAQNERFNCAKPNYGFE